MQFVELSLPEILIKLQQLDSNSKPSWGSLGPQRMVEHLTDAINLALGNHKLPLELPLEKVTGAQRFLLSEHPLPRNFEASFAPKDVVLRHNDLSEAISEFENAFKSFENYFDDNPNTVTLHPNFGELDAEHWRMLHRKHLTHHLSQFELL